MNRPATLGELRKSGYAVRSVREEIRANLVRMVREKTPLFPEIVGYEKTVIPDLVNALLSRHDFILLGLRGQAKTRILRGLTRFLDEAIPVIEGCEIHDHPMAPVCGPCRRRAAAEGDALRLAWLERETRYQEKLATPDVTMADLIGDVDPIKAATQRLALSDEAVIHYGIIPRSNRGIFAINELPDLPPRIQVGLLNIMQENDIQIRGFPVRLPLDILIVFSANPEDYTNRGNIITPLKDRIDSQILTHYPLSLDEAIRITDQEAWTVRDLGVEIVIPRFVREIVEQIAFVARESEYVDQTSGVSARLPISATENIISNMERRALTTGEKRLVARVCDVQAAVPAVTGKVELVFEGEKEGTQRVARHLIGKAVQRVFERYFPAATFETEEGEAKEKPKAASAAAAAAAASKPPAPYKDLLDWFSAGHQLELSDVMPASAYLERLKAVPGLKARAEAVVQESDPDLLAPVMELVLEGLHQSSRLAKEELEGHIAYRDMLQKMFSGFRGGAG